jgi:3-hydroxyisobutyrate dehydrogenase
MTFSPQKITIGFIGIGVMGKSMAGHLMAKGYRMHIYTRTKQKARELLDKGAIWEDSVASLALKCQVIISMVGYPHDVEEVYLGDGGIVANSRPGTITADMTTSSPELAGRIYSEAKARNVHALDAPVTGGDRGAREATLSIMVGGDESDFSAMLPVFECMGKTIVYQGSAGKGQHCKLANQIAIAMTLIGVCESLSYSRRAGLDEQKMLQSVSSGAAGSWQMSNMAPRMLKGDFAPGFFVKHLLKDLNIAAEQAARMGFNAPGLSLAKTLYDKLVALGEGESGTQALLKLYR